VKSPFAGRERDQRRSHAVHQVQQLQHRLGHDAYGPVCSSSTVLEMPRPGREVPRFRDPPPGRVIHITAERLGGVGLWVATT
jgi:hypothetical protein